jgi:hypothetical protein
LQTPKRKRAETELIFLGNTKWVFVMADNCVNAEFYRAVTTPMLVNGRDSTLYEVELLSGDGQGFVRLACLSEAQQRQVTDVLCTATILCALTSKVEPVVVWDNIKSRLISGRDIGEKSDGH